MNVYDDVLKMLQLECTCEHVFGEPVNELKIRSNDPMPARSKANIEDMELIESWDSPHRAKALKFVKKTTPEGLFEILHSMRRWYSGQTMARLLASYRKELSEVMDLDPSDAVGCFRGFKVPDDSSLAEHEEGDEFTLEITRNHSFSSWSLTEKPTHGFSGKSKGKIGLIIKLVNGKGIKPVLAPPERTSEWFNALYELIIGKSFRPTEQEYLIQGSSARVQIVKKKS
jgi:hypothetical protein